MKQSALVEALALPVQERIKLVEDIWDSIASEGIVMEPNVQEKRMIEERMAAFHLDPESGSSWEDVKRRILEKKG
ncbi:MAG: addiction module protein [Candidatus Sumerlaeia bacterium]|nr:addiction module protein [Candidatus Sumerlaeia bacterium]